ncbi:hypothetical protein FS749_004751 [Ceratobasidium sp. UAMH 11750]|nr:hypothetical protein FS749_004751 [Ceratobasidium sp. UAMH 11750]
MKISEHLFTSGDRLALAMTSRWHYAALGHTVYTHLSLSKETKIDLLVKALLADENRCKAILHLSVLFPLSHTVARLATGKYMTKESYYGHRQNLTEGVFIVLKLAHNLKALDIPCFGQDSYVQWGMINTWLRDPYSFKLKYLSLHAVPGALTFLERQTQLIQLTLLPGVEYAQLPPLPVSPISLPRLRTLWATPWWCGTILPYSPVQSFGLLRDDWNPAEHMIWHNCVDGLIKIGVHKTITSLTLTYEIVFWGDELVDLYRYEGAFPNVTRLGVTSGLELLHFEDTLENAKRLAKHYTRPLWTTVHELVFLLQEDNRPNPLNQRCSIGPAGRDSEVELLVTLEGLFSGLKHVDFANRHYSKAAEGGTWDEHPRVCRY